MPPIDSRLIFATPAPATGSGSRLASRSAAQRATLLAAALAALVVTVPTAATAVVSIGQGGFDPGRYAVIAIDADTGIVLHQANMDEPRYPASLAKMMTLYLTFERLEARKLDLFTPLRVSKHAADREPSKLGLEPGSTITTEQAILSLVTKSANDAAAVLGEALAGSESAFAKAMNRKARELGMTRSSFRNASGLPAEGQVTTARDLAVLARALIRDYPHYYHYFSSRHFRFRSSDYPSQNPLLGSYAGADGIKTGYTRASGYNLAASALRGDRRIIAVVMGGPTSEWTRVHMTDLLDVAFETQGRRATSLAAAKAAARAEETARAGQSAQPDGPAVAARPSITTQPQTPARRSAPAKEAAEVVEAPGPAARSRTAREEAAEGRGLAQSASALLAQGGGAVASEIGTASARPGDRDRAATPPFGEDEAIAAASAAGKAAGEAAPETVQAATGEQPGATAILLARIRGFVSPPAAPANRAGASAGLPAAEPAPQGTPPARTRIAVVSAPIRKADGDTRSAATTRYTVAAPAVAAPAAPATAETATASTAKSEAKPEAATPTRSAAARAAAAPATPATAETTTASTAKSEAKPEAATPTRSAAARAAATPATPATAETTTASTAKSEAKPEATTPTRSAAARAAATPATITVRDAAARAAARTQIATASARAAVAALPGASGRIKAASEPSPEEPAARSPKPASQSGPAAQLPKPASQMWSVQLGLFNTLTVARMRGETAAARLRHELGDVEVEIIPVDDSAGRRILARLARLSEDDARSGCSELQQQRVPCIVVPPGRRIFVSER